jgi:hypothetical protein
MLLLIAGLSLIVPVLLRNPRYLTCENAPAGLV